MLRLALVAAAVALAAATAAPARSAHECVEGGELGFRAADGTRLVGHRIGGASPGARTAVVLAHMSEGSLCDWVSQARRLAALGYFTFAFDLRGYGLSRGARDWARAPDDVAAAVRAVRALGAKKVVVVGASLGGIAAIVAAPRLSPPLAGVVAVSAPAAIAGALDARGAAARAAVPTLYLVGGADRNAQYDFARDARRLHRATPPSVRSLAVVNAYEHGITLVDASPRARAVLDRFLRRL